MTGFYDRVVLEAALGGACKEPGRVAALLAGNGSDLTDFGEIGVLHALALYLANLHARGEAFEREIAASAIAERTKAERSDVSAILADVEGRANLPAFDLFIERLRDLRFRRRIADLGAQAANGCHHTDLRAAVEQAIRESVAGSGGPSLTALRFAEFNPDVPPPVAFGDPRGDAILAPGDLVQFAGESGAGKSLALLDLGIALATGADWLGVPCSVDPGKVLIVTSDGDGADPVRARVARLGLGRGVEPEVLDTLPLRVVPVEAFNLDDPRAFASLERLVADFDPVLLGLETLSSMMGPDRDAYNGGQAADFIARRLRPLQKRPDGTRRTLVLTHHLRKRGNAPGANGLRDRVAGSYYLVGGVDSVIGFEPMGDSGFSVRLVKTTRWGFRFQPFQVRIEGNPPGSLVLHATGALEAEESRRGAKGENLFLEALSSLDGLPEGWATLGQVKDRAGIDPADRAAARRIERAAKRLAEIGRLEAHPERPAVYRIPVGGQSELPVDAME